MLAVDENYRKRKIGATLVKKAIEVKIVLKGKKYYMHNRCQNLNLSICDALRFLRFGQFFIIFSLHILKTKVIYLNSNFLIPFFAT